MAIVSENPPDLTLSLAVWPISGNTTQVRDFQQRLQTSSYHHGGRKHPNLMTPSVKNWISWCTEQHCDPVSGPIEDVNFLAHLYKEGYQYKSLNAYRSPIASMHTHIDGVSIGQHPLVSRLLRGAFQTRPPLPKCHGTWDLNKICGIAGENRPTGAKFPMKIIDL